MSLEEFLDEWHNDSPYVLVHTSGSTSKPKPMLVEKRRMEASAQKTCEFLGLKSGDRALLCLPLDFIAGKMMVVRALTCNLQLTSIEPSSCPCWEGPVDFAAMVPMQVWSMLKNSEGRKRLMTIKHLIIGGSAIDDSMSAELKDLPNAIWSTYGMTETLSHIALRRLNGPEATEWYTPFDGVQLSLNEDQCLVIDAPAVHDGPLVTNDIAELHPSPITNHPSPITHHPSPMFRILGRRDNTICSGGIKIQAEEVERRLQPFISTPFLITKCHDEKLGEAVVLMTEGDTDGLMEICRRELPRYWCPRRFVHVDNLPRTENGKVIRKML